MTTNDFKIASLTEIDSDLLKETESRIRSQLGKDIVLIAWEPK